MFGCEPKYLNFDNDLPGLVPKIFAKDLISKNNEHVGYCAFSPDGSELYYAITNNEWSISKLIKISADNLSVKKTLYLKDKIYEGEPFITNDGETIYFTVILKPEDGKNWQSDIYLAHKTQLGWSIPVKLDSTINSAASEWHISFTNNGIAYFTSEREAGTSALHGDIYSVELCCDRFMKLEKMPYPINTEYNDSDPLIAYDESFLIFHSNRPGGFGEHDLYVSFYKDGKWSDPKNMGNDINTNGWEMAPSLTPDGKYLLFTRRKALVTSDPAQIYWVSIGILDCLR
jgi:Tol biopolymer transport system component